MHATTRTQRPGAILAMLLGAGLVPTADADIIGVTNAGFENTTGQVVAGEFTFGTPFGWTIYDPMGITGDLMGDAGIWTGTLAPAIVPEFFGGVAPEGQRVAIPFGLAGVGGTGAYGFEQALTGSALEADRRYRLRVEIGNIGSGTSTSGTFFNLDGSPGYRVQLLAGGTIIAEDDNLLAGSIGEHQFRTSALVLEVGAGHANIGDELMIRLINLNETDAAHPGADLEVDFDDVRLTVVDLPESTTLALLVVGLLAVATARHQQRRLPS